MADRSRTASRISHPATWIFRGNPDDFDLIGYLNAGLPRISWTLRQHRRAVATKDEVYIWQSMGKERRPSGIIGRARIISDPFRGIDPDTLPYWRDQKKARADDLRVRLELKEAVESEASHRVISRASLIADPVCHALRVLHPPPGTNSLVEPEQAERLDALWRAAWQ